MLRRNLVLASIKMNLDEPFFITVGRHRQSSMDIILIPKCGGTDVHTRFHLNNSTWVSETMCPSRNTKPINGLKIIYLNTAHASPAQLGDIAREGAP